jgi:acetyl esterase
MLEQINSAQPRMYELDAVAARAQSAANSALIKPGPSVAEVRELLIPMRDGSQIAGRSYEPHAALGTIVWLHGGGWVFDGLDSTDATCRLLANSSGATVIGVDYRVAPEHPFPVPLDDCYDALRWVAGQADTPPIVLGGDSAGGNMAAVCAVRARDHGGPEIAAQVLVYPVTDSDMTTPAYLEHGDNEQLALGTRDMAWFFERYARDDADLADPDLAPLRTRDLSGLPPAIVVVAEYDPLRDDALLYAARLREAGVPMTMLHYDAQPHGFFSWVNALAAANEAVEHVGALVRKHIDSP